MKKIIFLLILLSAMILSVSLTVFAEGEIFGDSFNGFGSDVDFPSNNQVKLDVMGWTFGGNYSLNRWILGGEYLTGYVNVNNTGDRFCYMVVITLQGGCEIINTKWLTLTILDSYIKYGSGYGLSGSLVASDVNFRIGNASINAYLGYGLNLTQDTPPWETNSLKPPELLLYKLKFKYAVTDNFGLSLGYRFYKVSTNHDNIEFTESRGIFTFGNYIKF